jgi:putative flippase GtrA
MKQEPEAEDAWAAAVSRLALQFLQYVVVGGIAFVVDFTTLFVLTELAGLHYLVSASCGFTLGLAVNYVLCIRWIFDFRSVEKASHEFALFSLIGLIGLLLNNALLYVQTEFIGLHYLTAKLIAAAIILLFNFSLRRYLLFTERSKTPSASRV